MLPLLTIPPVIAKLLKLAHIDPKSFSRHEVERRMTDGSAAIASDMDKDGITLILLAEGGLTGEEERLVIRDAEFRLWRKVFSFRGGGTIADAFRDAQQNKVVAAVSPLVNEHTTARELVDVVREKTLELTF